MTDAESNVKKGRIRHAYPRKEVFHRFIHSPEYAYSPESSYKQVCCIGNYLLIRSLKYGVKDSQFVEDMWYNYKDRCIAVIDRTNKRIIVKSNYCDIYNIIKNVPASYDLFYSKKQLDYNVLTDPNVFLKLHAEYLISEFIEQAKECYEVIHSNKLTLNVNIDDILCDKYYFYHKIIDFVYCNELHKFVWYDKQLFNKPIILTGNHHPIKITPPTLKQIFDKNIFTDEERVVLNQKLFYTKYCYGFKISYKDVIKYWNKEVCFDDVDKYLKNKFAMNKDWFTDNEHTWNDYIKKAVDNVRALVLREDEANRITSDANMYKALYGYYKVYGVNDWRENKKADIISYNKYIAPSSRLLNIGKLGYWRRVFIHTNQILYFPNIALKLSDNRERVKTSTGMSVSILEAVKLFNIYHTFRKSNPIKEKWTINDFGDIKIENWKLKRIEHEEKLTNNGEDLGYKSWVFEIGCHKIWLDDIDDFIEYYHLEDVFMGKTNKDSIK